MGSCGNEDHLRNSSREVNIFTSHHMQSNGNCILCVTEIRYCPWCGEEIEVVRVKYAETATQHEAY